MTRAKWLAVTGIVITITAIVIRAAWETRPSRLRAMDKYEVGVGR